MADASYGGAFRHPDGARSGGVPGRPGGSRKGNRSAVLAAIVDDAVRRKAPRFLAGASAAHPDSVDWAVKRGFHEIGRRIESFVKLASFDPGPFSARLDDVRRSGHLPDDRGDPRWP